MTTFKEVALEFITKDPNQPRKYFDKQAMADLTASVKEKGILQAIILRPIKGIPDRYMLVSGQRRYEAATAAGVKAIPASIHQLTDEEALQVQITENLHRENVHPMEEAVAFKSLIENKNKPMTVEETAAKVGKSVFYVRQRLKLNSLTEKWQEVFYAGKMSISDCLQLAKMDEKTQDYIYKEGGVTKEALKDPNYFCKVNDYDINKAMHSISKAPFDTDDEKLNPANPIKCTGCRYNSASSALFTEDAKNPTCSNPGCYEIKSAAAFKINLDAAISDPAVVLVNHYCTTEKDEKLLKKLKEDGHPVYKIYSDFDPVSEKEKGFKSDLAAGKILKAFGVTGSDKGQWSFVRLFKKSPSGSASTGTAAEVKEKIKEGKATVADIDSEIERIKEKEKKAQELDLQKSHAAIVAEFEKKPNLNIGLQTIDNGIVIFMLLQKCGLRHDTIKGLPEFSDDYLDGEKYLEKLSKISASTTAMVIRKCALDAYLKENLQYGVSTKNAVIRTIAKYLGIDVKAIEDQQAVIAAARKEKVNARIKQLQHEKKLIAEPKKPAAK